MSAPVPERSNGTPVAPADGNGSSPAPPRPADLCRGLLDALEAAEARRRRRRRDTRPDAMGLAMKRELLERAVAEDPAPEAFEGWLLERCLDQPGEGGWRAMALQIWEEWMMAQATPGFGAWLADGAPSDDRRKGERP